MSMFIFTQSRVMEEERLKSVESFSQKILSTFDLVFDELRLNDKISTFIPDSKDNELGVIKTFNFKLTKEEESYDNFRYTFEHGKNKVIIETKFPLCGKVIKDKKKIYFTELYHDEESINYLNLIKKYLDYYVLDRDSTFVFSDGQVVRDVISDQDFVNREKSGYSSLSKKSKNNILNISLYQKNNVNSSISRIAS